MASSTERVTKVELIDMLKDYKDNDFVGVVFSAQDGKESPCHKVLVFYHKGIKQKELADKLGIAENTLSQYETGSREPDIETTKRIANELGVSVDELVGAKKEKPSGKNAEGLSDYDANYK